MSLGEEDWGYVFNISLLSSTVLCVMLPVLDTLSVLPSPVSESLSFRLSTGEELGV